MAPGAVGLQCGSAAKASAGELWGWVRAGVWVGCRRLVRACWWASVGWGRRWLWEGDSVIHSGPWRIEGRVFFWGLGVDSLNGISGGQGCDVFGNV